MSILKFILSASVVSCLLILAQSGYATTNSRPGGTGMTWMRTADTLNNDDLVVYDQLGIDTYVILNTNLNDTDTFNNAGINYGLFDSLELGLQTTYMMNDQHKTSGIRSHKGIVKLNVLGDKKTDNYAITISTFKTFSPASVEDKIGSGKSEDGTEINASYYGTNINLHLTLGSATADAKYYDPDVVYYSVEKQYYNIGAEFKVSDQYIFGIEAIQESSSDPVFDKNQVFAFSLQYKADKNWDMDFGTAFGIPADRSEPAQSFYIGFNYYFDEVEGSDHTSGKVKTKASSIPVPTYVPKPRPAFSNTPKASVVTPPPPKKKKAKKKAKSKNYKYRVVIKNATGSYASAERVASLLKQSGYHILAIESVSRRKTTEIRYLNKNSKQALQMAIKLPGNQDLRVMNRLGEDVDFELVIGADMVRSIR